jgi:hypothetical protein
LYLFDFVVKISSGSREIIVLFDTVLIGQVRFASCFLAVLITSTKQTPNFGLLSALKA